MGDLSKNFSRWEFECKGVECCGHSGPVDMRLVCALQELRNMAGSALHISSGFRCRKHNSTIRNASPTSQHTVATAADVWSREHSPSALAEMAETIDIFKYGGMGLYSGHLHVDIRLGRVRWGFA